MVKREYLTPTSFINVVINSKENPKSNVPFVSCCLQKLLGLSHVAGPCQHQQRSPTPQPPSCSFQPCPLHWWFLWLIPRDHQKKLSRAETYPDYFSLSSQVSRPAGHPHLLSPGLPLCRQAEASPVQEDLVEAIPWVTASAEVPHVAGQHFFHPFP